MIGVSFAQELRQDKRQDERVAFGVLDSELAFNVLSPGNVIHVWMQDRCENK